MKKVIISLSFIFGLLGTLLLTSLKVHAANVSVSQPVAGGRYALIPVAFTQSAPIVGNNVTYTFTPVPSGTVLNVVLDPSGNPYSTTLNPHALLSHPDVVSAPGLGIPDNFYNITVSWQRSSDNVVESTSINSVIIDTATLPIIYNGPTAGSNGNSMTWNFIVPEDVSPGTLKARMTDFYTSNVVTLTFSNSPANTPFTINPRNVTASPYIAGSSSGAVIPAGSYAIVMSYQDDLGNPTATTTGGSNVIVIGDPAIVINAPTKSAVGQITNTTIEVSSLEPISSSSVVIAAGTTANYTNFNCVQTAIDLVDCTIKITSSGNLVISGTSSSSYNSTSSENNYVVTSASGTPVSPNPTTTQITTTTNVNGVLVSTPVTNADGTPVTNAIVSQPVVNSMTSLLLMLLLCCLGSIVLIVIVGYLIYQNPKVQAWVLRMKSKIK